MELGFLGLPKYIYYIVEMKFAIMNCYAVLICVFSTILALPFFMEENSNHFIILYYVVSNISKYISLRWEEPKITTACMM